MVDFLSHHCPFSYPQGPDSQPLVVFRQLSDPYFRLFIQYGDVTLYFASVTSLKKDVRDNLNPLQIVAVPLECTTHNGYLWTIRDVTNEVDEDPVK